MADIVFRGTREQFKQAVRRLPAILAGRLPDSSGVADAVKLRMGLALLGQVKDNFVLQSEGGTGEFGEWEPLSAVTLALRRVGKGGEPKLRERFNKFSKARQQQVTLAEKRVLDLLGTATGRKKAMGLLRKQKKTVSVTRLRELERLLSGRSRSTTIKSVAFAAAMSLILRDTGRLLNSLTPGMPSADQVLRTEPGRLLVGTNLVYAKFHQSDRPRKLKADGTPRLPRRQFLPDGGRLPATWRRAMADTLRRALLDPAVFTGLMRL